MIGAIIGDIDGHRYAVNGERLGFSRIPAVCTDLTAFLMETAGWILKIRRGEPTAALSVSGAKGVILGIVIGYAARGEEEILGYLRHVAVGPQTICADIGNLARAVFRARRHEAKEDVLAVYEEAPIGIEAFAQTDTFADALTTSFALGEDAALDGMVCGAVAGAYYGVDNGMRTTTLTLLSPSMVETLRAFEGEFP